MYFLQQWFALADEALEDAIYDSAAMREFVGIDLGCESVPDAAALLKFRRLLETHDLSTAILLGINQHLSERGLLLSAGTLVDATVRQIVEERPAVGVEKFDAISRIVGESVPKLLSEIRKINWHIVCF